MRLTNMADRQSDSIGLKWNGKSLEIGKRFRLE